MDYLDDLMLLPSNGSASLRDPCLHGDLSIMYEHDVDGLLDMYERDEYSLDDPPVELPAPYSSVALSAFLCLDAQHATQAGALHTSTPHTPAITAPVCPSTATAQMPFTSINVAPAASCYAEPDAAHFITASAVSPPAAPSTTMDCTAKHASKDGPGVGTPCKLADQEVASAPTKIAKKCDKKPSKPVKAIVHSGKPVRKACPAACARLTDTTTGRKPGHRSFPWGAVWVKALVMKMRCAGASNTAIAAALTQQAGISISYSIVSRRFPQKEAASQGQTK